MANDFVWQIVKNYFSHKPKYHRGRASLKNYGYLAY